MVATAGPGWRLAPSLEQLYREVSAIDPNRPTASDGTIGDPDHQARDSDHNPWVYFNGVYWVTAMDLTDGGKIFDPDTFGETLRKRKDPSVKYYICDGRFYSSYATSSRAAWQWAEYNGPNGHFAHGHLSVLPNRAGIYRTGLGLWLPEATPTTQEDLVYRIIWFKNTGKAAAAYRCLYSKTDSGKEVPVLAYWIPNQTSLARWKKHGLKEYTTTRPANPFTVIMDGPYKNA
jgi:hypothetical protein